MNGRQLLVFVVTGLMMLFLGCEFLEKGKSDQNETIPNESRIDSNLLVSQELHRVLYSDSDSISALCEGQLKTLYRICNKSLVWNSSHSDSLIRLISNASNYGLDSNDYLLSALRKSKSRISGTSSSGYFKEIVQMDLLLSKCYFMFADHLKNGTINPQSLKPNTVCLTDTTFLPAYLDSTVKGNILVQGLLAQQPEQMGYRLLQNSLEKWQMQLKKEKRDRAEAESNDSLLKANELQYRKVSLNLERWRWESKWEPSYILVNIPPFYLQMIHKEKVVNTHKVIVGKEDSETMTLDGDLSYMVVYPKWTVPYSISSKEILPKIKKDPSYLSKRKYRVYDRNNNELLSDSIDWSTVTAKNFDYTLVRDAGTVNDLGLIKFIFPNECNIYIHDTPSKHLFNREKRSFSHGCIRIDKPFKLAENLLIIDSNSYNIDSVKNIIKRKKTQKIILRNPYQVYIRYFTATSDSTYKIQLMDDLYKKDNDLLKLMFEE